MHHKRMTAEHGQDNPYGDDMELIKAEAVARGCKPNKLMHALYCEAFLMFGRDLVRSCWQPCTGMLSLRVPHDSLWNIRHPATYVNAISSPRQTLQAHQQQDA